ncbi:MAG: 30S ribosomal protein S4 [Parcubacteria group bacterium]|nr:30S ribosomal protein S4 [Parcubacteria group bacterium]
MMDAKCKICRRAGEKLFLKGERCHTPKCAVVRKPYPPGIHSKKRGRKLSEYGLQLRQKQNLRSLYGMRERPFRNIAQEAMRNKETRNTEQLYRLLELRLDNVVFRLGLAVSRSRARQIVSHGLITINGRRVTIPSYRVHPHDRIAVRPQYKTSPLFQDIDVLLKKYQPPAWISLDKEKKEGEIIGTPAIEDPSMLPQLNTAIAFYSR